MRKKIQIMWLIMAGGVFSSACLKAQEREKWADFAFIKNSDAWLTSENAAGLNNLRIDKISLAEVSFNKSDGKFINYYQSNNSYSFGGRTESFFRINKKVVFYGQMNYSNFSGKNMGGSTTIDPYYNSFDIVEYADSTAGEKRMENYRLTGGIGTILWHDILLGLKADYKTVSYFKTRDLRHINDLMDMTITAGIRYRVKRIADAGINYYFRKTTESAEYESVGKKDQQFNSLISFGSFFGRQERFTEYGYTGSGDSNPFFNSFQGLSVQLDLLPENDFHFFNEFSIKWRKGYFGRNSDESIMFTRNKADIYQYYGLLSLSRNDILHQLSIKVDYENLKNFEKAYRKETSTGGNTTIVYYGESEVLNRSMIDASIFYTGNLHVLGNNPTWVISVGANFSKRDQTTTVYPFYRKQNINQILGVASVKRNFVSQNNMYSVCFGGKYGSGSGTAKDDGQYGSGSQGTATSIDRYLYREYDYLTASRVMLETGFRYTRSLAKNLQLYGEANYEFTKAFSVTYIENSFNRLALNVGCTF